MDLDAVVRPNKRIEQQPPGLNGKIKTEKNPD